MRTLPLILLIALLFAGSCSYGADSGAEPNRMKEFPLAESDPSYASRPAAPETATRTADSDAGSGSNETGSGSQTAASAQNISLNQAEAAQTGRKIIRHAELTLESDDPEGTQKQISAISEAKGGFVVETQQSSSDRRSDRRDMVTMTVRVPADKFAEALEEIRKTAGRVVVETVRGQDVTEEFIDIEARLKAHRALEEQFLEIMKRANSVADALNVQRQLAEVRGEIEKIEGRKRFLENQASLSTIKVRIQTPAAISASGSGFFYRLTEAVSTGFDAALGFVLGLVTVVIALIPFVLFICLPAYLLLRYLWKRIKRRRTAAEIAKEELAVETD